MRVGKQIIWFLQFSTQELGDRHVDHVMLLTFQRMCVLVHWPLQHSQSHLPTIQSCVNYDLCQNHSHRHSGPPTSGLHYQLGCIAKRKQLPDALIRPTLCHFWSGMATTHHDSSSLCCLMMISILRVHIMFRTLSTLNKKRRLCSATSFSWKYRSTR